MLIDLINSIHSEVF